MIVLHHRGVEARVSSKQFNTGAAHIPCCLRQPSRLRNFKVELELRLIRLSATK
jgi:hypothetical protein